MLDCVSQQMLAVPFRLDDLSSILIVLIALFSCAAHFLRQIILSRRGKPLFIEFNANKLYDGVQRFMHWFFLILAFVLFITGFMIFKIDYLITIYPPLAELSLRSLVSYHWYFSLLLILTSIIHAIYDAVLINRIKDMMINLKDLRNFGMITKILFGSKDNYPKIDRYHPMQKMLHWAIVIVLFFLGFTGLTIWSPFLVFIRSSGLSVFEEWLYIYNSRYLHDLLAIIFVALMIGHLYFSTVIPANRDRLRILISGRIRRESNA